MRFKYGPQLPGAGRKRAGHHHGSHTPTSPGTISLGKMAYHTKQIRRECINAVSTAARQPKFGWAIALSAPLLPPLMLMLKVGYSQKILVLFPLAKKCAVFYPKFCILNFPTLGHCNAITVS
jgi:hypothetical protein